MRPEDYLASRACDGDGRTHEDVVAYWNKRVSRSYCPGANRNISGGCCVCCLSEGEGPNG